MGAPEGLLFGAHLALFWCSPSPLRLLSLLAFSRAIDINSNDPVIYYNKSLVHIVRLELDEASALFKKAVEIKADFVEAKQALEKVPAWKESLEAQAG